jgi:hemerythrin
MRLFHWTRAKSVFVPELDAEHRNLYQIAEEAHKALLAGAPLGVTTPQIRALLAAAEDHFAHEERLMREARYPLLKWHSGQHDTVRKHAAELLPLIEAEDPTASTELLEFVGLWLKEHTAVADRMMSAALRAYSRLRAA